MPPCLRSNWEIEFEKFERFLDWACHSRMSQYWRLRGFWIANTPAFINKLFSKIMLALRELLRPATVPSEAPFIRQCCRMAMVLAMLPIVSFVFRAAILSLLPGWKNSWNGSGAG